MVKRFQSDLALRLGRNVATLRRHASLTQEQFAELLGVEIATVSRYETGATLPSLVTLELMAASLHCTVADLLAEDVPKQSSEGARIEAMLSPLSSKEKQLVLGALRKIIDLLCSRPAALVGKRTAK